MEEDIQTEGLVLVTSRLEGQPRALTFVAGTSATHIQVPEDAEIHVRRHWNIAKMLIA